MYCPHTQLTTSLSSLRSSPSSQDLETTDEHLDVVKESLDMAVGDLERAFKHFFENHPDKSRPIIVVAHSQGAILMSRVLATWLQGTEHEVRSGEERRMARTASN
jgi:hypothetical protein